VLHDTVTSGTHTLTQHRKARVGCLGTGRAASRNGEIKKGSEKSGRDDIESKATGGLSRASGEKVCHARREWSLKKGGGNQTAPTASGKGAFRGEGFLEKNTIRNTSTVKRVTRGSEGAEADDIRQRCAAGRGGKFDGNIGVTQVFFREPGESEACAKDKRLVLGALEITGEKSE